MDGASSPSPSPSELIDKIVERINKYKRLHNNMDHTPSRFKIFQTDEASQPAFDVSIPRTNVSPLREMLTASGITVQKVNHNSNYLRLSHLTPETVNAFCKRIDAEMGDIELRGEELGDKINEYLGRHPDKALLILARAINRLDCLPHPLARDIVGALEFENKGRSQGRS